MKRRKLAVLLVWVFCVNELTTNCFCDVSASYPSPSSQSAMNGNLLVTKFQNAIQQQNTVSILSSIEERLRNLDNIYSMQLSQNLETKLDQYSTKLENLDSKLMRLEALFMMNLGKISENISAKNFKDDMTKTDNLRKLDSIYEGITHKLNYIERKLESNNAKIEEKMENTFIRLSKMEQGTTKRDSDLETELSAAITAIDDLKKTYRNTEQKLMNATDENLTVSKHTFNVLTKCNIDTRKSMNKLHDNIVGNLQYLDNRTTQHIKITEDTNIALKQMKIDLKEDFNNYANKVADMNSDMWKNTDTTEDDLKNIASVVNDTKIDLQNGVRSLMIQIGKLSQKDTDVISGSDYKKLEQKLSANFDKVLTNQDVFLESCHRLQMDESQIESEISVMLNKLIDMLEKKLSSEVKDIKNFEKNLKNHDNRINRNLFQANQNIISLFEKSTMNTQMITAEIRKIGTDLNALFAFVQSTTNDEASSSASAVTSKVILDKLTGIEKSTRNLQNILPNHKAENTSNHQIYKEIQKLSKSLSTAIEKLQNYTKDVYIQQSTNYVQMLDNIVKKQNETIRQTILAVFGENPNKTTENPEISDNIVKKNMGNITDSPTVLTSTSKPEQNETIRQIILAVFGENPNKTTEKPKINCSDDIRNLIDIRADANNCTETSPKPETTENIRKQMKYDIDIRGDVSSRMNVDKDEEYDATSTSTIEPTTTTFYTDTITKKLTLIDDEDISSNSQQ